MTVIRTYHNKENRFVYLKNSIIHDKRISFEGIGVYGMLESGSIKVEDIPKHLIKELILVGVIQEVEE